MGENPIIAPAIDNSPVPTGPAAMVEAFTSSATTIGEKLQTMQRKFSSSVTATQTNLAAWGPNVAGNISSVLKFIP